VLPIGNCPRVARREEPHVALLGVIAGSIDSSEIALRLCSRSLIQWRLFATLHVGFRAAWSCFALLAPGQQREAWSSTGTVDGGYTPLETARDGLRPLEAASPAASIEVAQRRH
jgi:hypothetical protein